MRNVMLKAAVVGATLGISMTALAHEDHEEEEVHLVPHEVGGIELEGGVTWFLQGSSGVADDTTALSYSLDIGLQRQISEHGKVLVALEAGDGQGIDGTVGSLSALNYDAFFTELTTNVSGSTNVVVPSISQAFYEGEYAAGSLVVNVGKLDVHSLFDDNAYANDETDQFLSAIFTRSADTSYKQLDYYYAPGVAAMLEVSDAIGVTLIAANGNRSGFDSFFDNMYLVGQVNLRPNLGGYEGNYRFYALNDARDSVDDNGSPITSFTEISSGKKTENTAWGLSFDQALPGGIGLFARYSSQDDGIVENLVESSWSFGALVEGSRWGRPHDAFGLGYGSVNLNKDPAVIAAAGGITRPDDETHFETFYKFGFSHHFTLTADIQVIGNNGGEADADTVTVAGLRGQLNF